MINNRIDIEKEIKINLVELAEEGGATLDEVLLTMATPLTLLNFKEEKEQTGLMKNVGKFVKRVRKDGNKLCKSAMKKLLQTEWLPTIEEEEKKRLVMGFSNLIYGVDEDNCVLFNPKYVEGWRNISAKYESKLIWGDPVEVVSGGVIKCSNWQEFSSSARKDKYYVLRMKMLEKAHAIFKSVRSFNDLDVDTKKKLAGLLKRSENETMDWCLFGSMKGMGYYKQDIPSKESKYGGAIDLIPLEGEVTKADFDAYRQAFAEYQNPIAIATRLLAIKRPDLFMCMDSKNKEMLATLLKCRKVDFTWDNYWETMTERVWKSAWYNTPESEISEDDKALWRCRAAMFDALSYEPEE